MRKSSAPSQIFCSNKGKRNIGDVLSLLNESNNISVPISKTTKDIDVQNKPEDNKIESNKTASSSTKDNVSSYPNTKYTVVWGKPSTKKHKTWDGDGTLEVSNKCLVLYGDDGNILGTKSLNTPMCLEVGQILSVGSKVVEIIEPLLTSGVSTAVKRPREEDPPTGCVGPTSKIIRKKSFQSPLTSVTPSNTTSDQFIFPQPPGSHQWIHNENKRPVLPVALDTFLSSRLRLHQKEGIAFLYSCVMGYSSSEHTGAILADEMGLGKTLQCIALIWTLLKQGPYGIPVVKRALIITPSTLCGAWNCEFIRWLGRERITPFVIDNQNKPLAFKARPNLPVMIISYERFVKHADEIQSINFDIVLCDEAHRLKNANIKAAQALQNLACKKRILLTGTPIQNDLQEYFVLIDIANPGILGTYNDFKEQFVNPILISQRPECTEEESIAGEQSASHLQRITSSFILRRTQALLKDYLPSKTELVICCNVSSLQEKLYLIVLDHWWRERDLGSAPSPLSLIVLLKKICNCPLLLLNKSTSLNDVDGILSVLQRALPSAMDETKECSGKLSVLKSLMEYVLLKKREKLVIVSCSTKMLDILTNICKRISISFVRLDGSTPVSNRQSIVGLFNSNEGPPVLLLSSRAGGSGLSLPAASHLVLYDSDWNPAVDNQAMARIWRDGQKKPVFIYRLLVTGSIEEKIYQRQMFKMGISDAIIDPDNVKATLKLCDAELKELFVTNFTSHSTTHDMLECECAGDGTPHQDLEEFENNEIEDKCGRYESNNMESSINQLKTWDHFDLSISNSILLQLGLNNLESVISFIFKKKTI